MGWLPQSQFVRPLNFDVGFEDHTAKLTLEIKPLMMSLDEGELVSEVILWQYWSISRCLNNHE
jgi:hypothetical protein